MKLWDLLFIFGVIIVLFGMTAMRYRKQIAGMIGVAKALRDASDAAQRPRVSRSPEPQSTNLVNCAGCGVWVPQNKAMKLRDGHFYCEKCRV